VTDAAGLVRLAEEVRAGRPRAIARAISLAESHGPDTASLLGLLFPSTGRAQIVGVTGAPGAGKSTLVQRIAQGARAEGRKVGILAVDPTSPFSGGAILGDRIRMQELYLDPGVFIRSMATRGALGGLSRATSDALDVLDSAGFDLVIVETVGVGQDEVDVIRTVDTVLVLLVPGLGDDIQAIKAGIMEIADVFVVNKADRPGAERTISEIEAMLGTASEHGEWIPPIVPTVASKGTGIDRLAFEIARHRAHLATSDEGRRRRTGRLRNRLETLLREGLFSRVKQEALPEERLAELLDQLEKRSTDPWAAAATVLEKIDVRGWESA
jgi:LAO/AO transport system kinase